MQGALPDPPAVSIALPAVAARPRAMLRVAEVAASAEAAEVVALPTEAAAVVVVVAAVRTTKAPNPKQSLLQNSAHQQPRVGDFSLSLQPAVLHCASIRGICLRTGEILLGLQPALRCKDGERGGRHAGGRSARAVRIVRPVLTVLPLQQEQS